MQVSKPEAITRISEGRTLEPIEQVVIDCPKSLLCRYRSGWASQGPDDEDG